MEQLLNEIRVSYMDPEINRLLGSIPEAAPDGRAKTHYNSGEELFLELEMPMRAKKDERFTVRHATKKELALDFHRFIHEHPTADQSTAHHKDSGWLLAYSPGLALESRAKVISVTDVAPTILSLFGLPAKPWMEVREAPVFAVKR